MGKESNFSAKSLVMASWAFWASPLIACAIMRLIVEFLLSKRSSIRLWIFDIVRSHRDTFWQGQTSDRCIRARHLHVSANNRAIATSLEHGGGLFGKYGCCECGHYRFPLQKVVRPA